jgi:hypothetical protein
MFVLMCNLKYQNIVTEWKDKTLESMNAQSIKSHWDICIQPLFRKTSLSKKNSKFVEWNKIIKYKSICRCFKKTHPPSLYIFFTRNKTHTHTHTQHNTTRTHTHTHTYTNAYTQYKRHLKTDGMMDGQTDGQTDGQMNGRTDIWTDRRKKQSDRQTGL